ncbi:hypothetical protein BDK51DRAFT_42380 [Blyttiomyces helicus]|uniref:Galactose oxidase n=1 Tax=Blyttiomyces helicus TaxID=388810 RepID=A0A4P9W5Z1_9FUNG|nr:hypothetical protein BDK51DRAFT_42380 [Blyttiomyces helicus]|eukprot:RKO86755.1 hypothetical protein BDK51DRAFT_42380 [Blyttiomyces helicus]
MAPQQSLLLLLLAALLPVARAFATAPDPNLNCSILISCPAYPNQIFLYGGGTVVIDAQTTELQKAIWRFDIPSSEWTPLLPASSSEYTNRVQTAGCINSTIYTLLPSMTYAAADLSSPPTPPLDPTAGTATIWGHNRPDAVRHSVRQLRRPAAVVYDPAADEWALGPSLPEYLMQASVAVVNGSGWVFGGYHLMQFVNDIYTIGPPYKQWVQQHPVDVVGVGNGLPPARQHACFVPCM